MSILCFFFEPKKIYHYAIKQVLWKTRSAHFNKNSASSATLRTPSGLTRAVFLRYAHKNRNVQLLCPFVTFVVKS
jgi:hypothetical protein